MDPGLVAQLQLSNPDVLVEAYLKLRRMRDEIRKKEKVINVKMEMLSNVILLKLADLHIDSFKAGGANVYRYELTTTQLADRDQFLEHIINTGSWNLLDLRSNKDGALEYEANNNQPPPGVVINRTLKLGVRKA